MMQQSIQMSARARDLMRKQLMSSLRFTRCITIAIMTTRKTTKSRNRNSSLSIVPSQQLMTTMFISKAWLKEFGVSNSSVQT